MTRLIVSHEQFPQAIPADAKTGDIYTFSVTARVRRLEDEVVDVTTWGNAPQYLTGAHEIELLVTNIERIDE
jgi:hypothetical protein